MVTTGPRVNIIQDQSTLLGSDAPLSYSLEVSIPRKLNDEQEPTIKIKIKDRECYALNMPRKLSDDLGASVSTIPKTLCDILGFHDLDDCSLNLHLADSTIKKPMGHLNKCYIYLAS